MASRVATDCTDVPIPTRLPAVAVVVPCRNEVGHARDFIESLRAQDYPPAQMEVIIADGMSDDGTRTVLQSITGTGFVLSIVDNPAGIVSTGLNLAVMRAQADVIVRMDMHTTYATDYIRRCVETLSSSDAACVGGAWRAVGQHYMQRVIAVAFASPFGSGGAQSHRANFSGEVDSVYLGCWKRETLLEAGLFDEELVRNQDDELCLRIRRRGGRIWQSATIQSWYCPRGSIRGLARQYYQYGYWKVRVIQKHRQVVALRHLIPALFVLCGSILLLASVWSSSARVVLACMAGLYLALALFAAVRAGRANRDWSICPALPAVFATYHVSYGAGFLRGLVDFLVVRGRPASHATSLSR